MNRRSVFLGKINLDNKDFKYKGNSILRNKCRNWVFRTCSTLYFCCKIAFVITFN